MGDPLQRDVLALLEHLGPPGVQLDAGSAGERPLHGFGDQVVIGAHAAVVAEQARLETLLQPIRRRRGVDAGDERDLVGGAWFAGDASRLDQ